MKLEIDARGALQLAADAALWPKHHDKAKRRASNETARTARSKTISKVARDAGTLARRVRRRSNLKRARFSGRRDYARVWMGTKFQVAYKPSKRPPKQPPFPPMFKARMPSGNEGWFYRHPTKRMLTKNKAAIVQMGEDLTPHVEKHLPRESERAWERHYRTRYEREFARQLRRR